LRGLKVQACFDEWMTTVLDSELKLVPNWNLKNCRSAIRSGLCDPLFFCSRQGREKRRELAQRLKKEANELIDEIWNLVEPVITAHGLEILEIEYRREPAGWVLRIFLDAERGISV